jgi:hypothetical protein
MKIDIIKADVHEAEPQQEEANLLLVKVSPLVEVVTTGKDTVETNVITEEHMSGITTGTNVEAKINIDQVTATGVKAAVALSMILNIESKRLCPQSL